MDVHTNDALQVVYKKMPAQVLQLIEKVVETGTGNLYAGIVSYSQVTLKPALEIIELMDSLSLETPNLTEFEKFSFDQQSGWGNSFERF